MILITGIAIVLILAGATGVIHLSDGAAAVIVGVGAFAFIIGIFTEGNKDEEAYRNWRDHWRKRR